MVGNERRHRASARVFAVVATLLFVGSMVPVAQAVTYYQGFKALNGGGPDRSEFRLGDTVQLSIKVTTGAQSTSVSKRIEVRDGFTGAYLGAFDDGSPETFVPPHTVRTLLINWPQTLDGIGAVAPHRYRIDYVPVSADGASASTVVDVEFAPDLDLVHASTLPSTASPTYLVDSLVTKRFMLCIVDRGTDPLAGTTVRMTYAVEGDSAGSSAHEGLVTDVTFSRTRECAKSLGGGYYVEVTWTPTIAQRTAGASATRDVRFTLDPWDVHWEFDETNNARSVPMRANPGG